jgi:hypothetical protein
VPRLRPMALPTPRAGCDQKRMNAKTPTSSQTTSAVMASFTIHWGIERIELGRESLN